MLNIVVVVNLRVADTARGEPDGGDDGAVAGWAGDGDGQQILVSESLDTDGSLMGGRARAQSGTRGAGTETRVHWHGLVNSPGLDNNHFPTWDKSYEDMREASNSLPLVSRA